MGTNEVSNGQPSLSLTRTILEHMPLHEEDRTYWAPPEGDETIDSHVITLSKEAFRDMGKPKEITVTVERGDTLNQREMALLGLATTEELLGELQARVSTSNNQFKRVIQGHLDLVQGTLSPSELAYKTAGSM